MRTAERKGRPDGKKEKRLLRCGVSGMKILLPIITREENSPEFIDAATQNADNVLLLLVIDTSEMPAWQFGFAAGEIMQGTDFLEDLKKSVGKRKKSAVEITEWGNTVSKIAHIAELQN